MTEQNDPVCFRELEAAYLRQELKNLEDVPTSFFLLAVANRHYAGEPLHELQNRFEELVAEIKQRGGPFDSLSDDEQALLGIEKKYASLDGLPRVTLRRAGKYWVELNPLRGVRPKRECDERAERYEPSPILKSVIVNPAHPYGFHFSRSFVDREVFLEEEETTYCLNKYPYASGHALAVLDRGKRVHPQFLTPTVWAWFETLQRRYPRKVIAWNSLGAFASVNNAHLHICDSDAAVYSPVLGAPGAWPFAPVRFEGDGRFEALERFLFERIHDRWGNFYERPVYYNILARGEELCLVTRRDQRLYGKRLEDGFAVDGGFPVYGTGAAWNESGGKIVIPDEPGFRNVTEEELDVMFRQEGIPL